MLCSSSSLYLETKILALTLIKTGSLVQEDTFLLG